MADLAAVFIERDALREENARLVMECHRLIAAIDAGVREHDRLRTQLAEVTWHYEEWQLRIQGERDGARTLAQQLAHALNERPPTVAQADALLAYDDARIRWAQEDE